MARPKNKQQAILASAAEMFLEKGFSDTSIQEIAERAGLGKGTLYTYYNSKDDLFIRAVEYINKSLITKINEKCSDKSGFTNRLRIFVVSYHNILLSGFGNFNFMIINKISFLKPQTQDRFAQIMDEQRRSVCLIIKEILDQGIQEGIVRDVDREFAAMVINDMVFPSAARCWKEGYGAAKRDEEKEKLLDLIINGIVKK